MGGTLTIPGNVTPVGGDFFPASINRPEFNIVTDPEAASILFSMTSLTSTTHSSAPRLSRPLKLILFPLDATHLHGLRQEHYESIAKPALAAGSPLAIFLDAILRRTYRRLESLISKRRELDFIELHMHDPLCVYYAMLGDEARGEWIVEPNADVRVECTGTWTRGMTVLDQRVKGQRAFEKRAESCTDQVIEGEDTDGRDYEGVDDDEGGWRGRFGNRIDVIWASSIVDGGNFKTVEAMANMLWR